MGNMRPFCWTRKNWETFESWLSGERVVSEPPPPYWAYLLYLCSILCFLQDLHPHKMPWRHRNYTQGYDAHSLRRGYEVYRQVCSTCHSMKYLTFRRLIGHTHTQEQAKALAKTYEYEGDPDDNGVVHPREGIIIDNFKSPYKNQNEMRAANSKVCLHLFSLLLPLCVFFFLSFFFSLVPLCFPMLRWSWCWWWWWWRRKKKEKRKKKERRKERKKQQ